MCVCVYICNFQYLNFYIGLQFRYPKHFSHFVINILTSNDVIEESSGAYCLINFLNEKIRNNKNKLE